MDRDKLCDPREIPEEQWSSDVSLWPELEFGQIILTLLKPQENRYTREKWKSYKSLDAYNYYIRYHNLF